MRTTAEGPRVRCEVIDTGLGMPGHVRERAFEPFFSTKLETGSGLGLSIVYGIVTRHGGTIDVETALAKGTTFTLTFKSTRELQAKAPGGEVIQPPPVTNPADGS